MVKYWDVLLEEQRGPYLVIVDKTWEDIHPRDLFDDSCWDIDEICSKIDRGLLDWFMLRARVFYEGVELASDLCGGFLYEDAREVLKDGTAEDLIGEALAEALKQAQVMKAKFAQLEVA
jgi:hypothetical protein